MNKKIQNFLRKQENISVLLETNLLEKTSGWKIVNAVILEGNIEKTAQLIFRFNGYEKSVKKTKYIVFERDFHEKLSEYDWKITNFDYSINLENEINI